MTRLRKFLTRDWNHRAVMVKRISLNAFNIRSNIVDQKLRIVRKTGFESGGRLRTRNTSANTMFASFSKFSRAPHGSQCASSNASKMAQNMEPTQSEQRIVAMILVFTFTLLENKVKISSNP